ncbi:hypothetical protein [Polymorphospora rubra]|uniref:Uncharacterized protein n=1 Tax=Polymorphospora rubra TaxID=338584 RepID=A0A810N746_9ACTN|nr:hypothetical protein [Polymorphospora rubra]BCJ69097.1 hypothetical protein Prubr_61180 [Polymorphospora rubra]
MNRRRGSLSGQAGLRSADLVHLAVPAEYVNHIVRLIEDLDQRNRPLPPPAPRPRPAGPRHDREWPVEELRRFAQGRSRTHETVVAILDLLSDLPDQRLRVAEIAARLGSPADKIIGAMAGLTRIVKAYHDYPALGLPLRRVTQPAAGRSGSVSYTVTAEQARRWKAARATQPHPLS